MQQAVHHGRTPYLPNAVGGGCPFLAGAEDGGYIHVPRQVQGAKVRERGPDDEYAQATLFWNSMTRGRAGPHRRRLHLRARQGRGAGVVEAHGPPPRARATPSSPAGSPTGSASPSPTSPPTAEPDAVRHAATCPTPPVASTESPALAMVTEDAYPPDGRVVQILADDGADLAGIRAVRDALVAAGAAAHVVATHKGAIAGKRRGRRADSSTARSTPPSSAEADAIVVAGGAGLADEPGVDHLRAERVPPLQADRGVGRRHQSCSTAAGIELPTARASSSPNAPPRRSPRRVRRRACPCTATGIGPASTPLVAARDQEV